MRRKAWVAIRNGQVMPCFYMQHDDSDEPITPGHFINPHEVQIAGPVNIEAPPPPTDMVGMTRVVWSNRFGYVHLAD